MSRAIRRILVIAPFELAVEGGAATVVRALRRAWQDQGLVVDAREMIGMPGGALAQWRDLRTRGAAGKILEMARQTSPDVVHFHNFAGGVSAAAVGEVARALAGRVAVAITLHDHYALCHRGGFVLQGGAICPGAGARCLVCPGRIGRREVHRPLRLAATRHHLSAPVGVIAPSHHARDTLAASGYENARAIVNGVDLATFHTNAATTSEERSITPIVLAVGRASPPKGIHVFAAAARALGGRARFVWIGARAAAAAARLGGAFTGLDPLPAATLAEHYRAAAVVVMPSLARETFGLVAAEAMACGRPVVASTSGALPEVVDAAGLLVPPDDEQALTRAITELLDDPARRHSLGAAAATAARARFDWSRAAAEYLQVFDELGTVRE